MRKTVKMLAVLPAVAMLVGCGKPTIDMSPYVEINVDGYNSVGTAEAVSDKYNFFVEVESAIGKKSNLSSETIKMIVGQNTEGALDKTENLSNGDVVTFTWDAEKINQMQEQLNINLKAEPVTLTVEGLEEPQKFDPFDYLDVTYSGTEPEGYVELSVKTDNPVNLNGWYFNVDKIYGLCNGAQITVTFNCESEYLSLQPGWLPTAQEKVYTVEGLDYYPEKLSDIPQKAFDELDAYATNDYKSQYPKYYNELQSMELIGYYLLRKKETDLDTSSPSKLYSIYKIKTFNSKNETEQEYYYIYQFSNTTINPDGSYSVNPESARFAYIGIWGKRQWEDLDSLYSNEIASQLDDYTLDTNIK